ncbi:hypothetical protein SEA_NICOLE72_43 [Microbacterium phage Nicole72]|uniref:Uncharacterized protein n=1 Tax=Microbacterium phage Nicole72 TaxID=3062838 RepID=A0ACD4UJY6_9CAUD|nr:hypothetical protein SEA_NICOLE72_43 [Microbacterium phage Nicole72]
MTGAEEHGKPLPADLARPARRIDAGALAGIITGGGLLVLNAVLLVIAFTI